MNKLRFNYSMQISYAQPVSLCHFTIKCIPLPTARQRVLDTKISVLPKIRYAVGTDSFGNGQIHGRSEEPHTMFSFRITGMVETGLCEYEEAEEEWRTMVFRHPYGLNRAGEGLKAYFSAIFLPKKLSNYEKALILMKRLHQDFIYEKNCTNIRTTAEEAWNIGKGVCQDYSHILIALCHLAKIPARYVTGMLIGEGFSHAWTEVFSDGKWYGLDATNNTRVTVSHIRIGCGRDASDCQINRGVMWGGGTQMQQVCVKVERADKMIEDEGIKIW